jgi:hypothetical protein
MKLRPASLSMVAITGFILLNDIGFLTLDLRFRRNQFNYGLPPTTYRLSQALADNTVRGQLIITNLDAWAAWYQSLTTMWFPIDPEMLQGYETKVRYIALTDYNANDADFALGKWAPLLAQPKEISTVFIAHSYHLAHDLTIRADNNFENKNWRLVIYERNDDGQHEGSNENKKSFDSN